LWKDVLWKDVWWKDVLLEGRCVTKSFSFRMMNFQQHQCKGRPHTQKKAQGAVTSMADALLRNVERSQFIWRALY
jgi:hypothetical protein